VKTGRTLQELAAEIERQSATKRDFLVDTSEHLTMLTTADGSELHIAGCDEFGLRPLAHEQIADYLDIPRKFYGRLREGHPALLDNNVNALLRHEPKRRMVRTLDGQVRAFLSDRYRRLDNDELAEAILPVLGEIPDVQFPSTEITETRLYIKAVAPRVTGEVRQGDFLQAGVVISNSEVGMGALLVQPLVYRLVCTNGMIAGTATRRFHVGRQVDSTEAMEVYRDETLRADDRAFWLKVRDVVRAAVQETRFLAIVERLRLSAETPPMQDPSRGVEELGRRFHLGEQEQVSVLRHLTLGGDLTQYGALNAVTRASQDVADYDRATELEAIGGAILAMDGREWRTVAEAAR
jgi:hypothetical protein